jgi:hypothetical protein
VLAQPNITGQQQANPGSGGYSQQQNPQQQPQQQAQLPGEGVIDHTTDGEQTVSLR